MVPPSLSVNAKKFLELQLETIKALQNVLNYTAKAEHEKATFHNHMEQFYQP